MKRSCFKIHDVQVLPAWRARKSTVLILLMSAAISVLPFLALLNALRTIEIKNAEIERLSFELLLADAKIYDLHEQGLLGKFSHPVDMPAKRELTTRR